MKQQTEMENFMLRTGMFLADRYEILDQIGTGGMSDVYRAKCHKLNRFVAIKVLKKEYSEDKTFVSKFRIRFYLKIQTNESFTNEKNYSSIIFDF